MSKKFFSLISGKTVRIAPKTKVIPASEYSTLQTAQEILTTVQQEAIQYKKDVVKETEKLKEQAQREGYDAGFKQWSEALVKLEEEISRVHKEMEKLVIPVALSAAKKIVNRELDLSEAAIVDIVSANLKAVSQHKKVVIYVNKKDLDVLEANRPRLKQLFESLEALSIRERSDVARGGCIIETEGGIINAQLENRWRILEGVFSKLIKAK